MSRSRSSPDCESAAAQKPHDQRVRLSDLLARSQDAGTTVFFFGSEARIVYALRDKVASDFPRLAIAGICDADFSGAVSPAIVGFIAAAKPGMIIVDMAEREFCAFARANEHRFPDALLVHLDGAFGAYVHRQGRQAILPLRSQRSGVPLLRFVGHGLSAARFCGIILAQVLQGGMSRVRVARSGAAMRRDG